MDHKKLSYFFLFLLIGCGSLWAQENTSKRVKIGDNKKEKSGETPFKLAPPNSKNTPEKLLYPVAETLEKNGIKMLPDRTLVQAGAYLKIDPKIREKESKKAKNYFGNVNLGAVKTVSKFVGVVCRDHEYVDGDRVRIYLNGDIVAQNLFLTAGFQGVNVDLKEGVNTLVFEALNQGASGPNTAQVDVYDEKANLVHQNIWNLSTGAKATMVLVRE
ncbi:hypothetical protein PQY69_01245 [Flavobacteriaceae bacterium]|nr:hypothetical protein [Flavobacteriaceae bacterium]